MRVRAFTGTLVLWRRVGPAGLVLVCHVRLTGHGDQAAGLRLSVASTAGRDVESLLPARTQVRSQRAWVDRQVSSEEKECEAISQRPLHQVKVAVRTAKQDAHSVHFHLDRRGPACILKPVRPG